MLGKNPIFLSSKFLHMLLHHITHKSIFSCRPNKWSLHGILKHLLGTKLMSGEDRGPPIISVPIFELLNVALQCNLQ